MLLLPEPQCPHLENAWISKEERLWRNNTLAHHLFSRVRLVREISQCPAWAVLPGASLLSTSSICPEARAHIPESSNRSLCPQAGPSFQLFHGVCPQDKAPSRFQSPTSLSSPASHAFFFLRAHLLLPTSGPLNMLLLLPGMQCVLLSSFPPPLLLDESHLSFKSQHGCCHREPSQCPRLYQALFLIPLLPPPWPPPPD